MTYAKDGRKQIVEQATSLLLARNSDMRSARIWEAVIEIVDASREGARNPTFNLGRRVSNPDERIMRYWETVVGHRMVTRLINDIRRACKRAIPEDK